MNRNEAGETSGKGERERDASLLRDGEALTENVVFADGISLVYVLRRNLGKSRVYWLVGNFGIRDCM